MTSRNDVSERCIVAGAAFVAAMNSLDVVLFGNTFETIPPYEIKRLAPWDVDLEENGWVLNWWEKGLVVLIGKKELEWETAVDSACEFMDRVNSNSRLPENVLMDRCVRSSLMQQ